MDKRCLGLSRLAKQYGYLVTRGGRHYKLLPIDGNGPHIAASISPKNEQHFLKQVEKDLLAATKGTGK